MFKKVWQDKGDQIIDFLYQNTNLEFKRNIIDCHIVSATPRDMSSPLIIRSRYDEKEFLYTMLHELIHVLFSDNKTPVLKNYEQESKTTRNHIILYALVTKYYTEIEKDPDFLQQIQNISDIAVNVDYKRAWEIVGEVGYGEFEKLKHK